LNTFQCSTSVLGSTGTHPRGTTRYQKFNRNLPKGVSSEVFMAMKIQVVVSRV